MTTTPATQRRPFLRGVLACAYIAALGCEGLATVSIVQHGPRVVSLQDKSFTAFVGSSAKMHPVGWRQRRGHSNTGAPGCSPSMVASVKVNTPMTLTEKIIAKACDRPSVAPNDNVWVKTDVLMTHDVCGPGTIGNFYKEFGLQAKVWDQDGVVIIPDHYIFTADPRANRNVDILRDFVNQQGIKYFYDITDRGNFKVNVDYKGVCHVALAQEGHTRPGEVLFGTDSHTCNAGAFGQFATGIGNTDASFVMGTGKLLIKSPASMLFSLEGGMPDHLLAKVITDGCAGKR